MNTLKDPLRTGYVLRARTHKITLGQKTRIMAILNLTPDSFSQDGCLAGGMNDPGANLDRARELIREGADILDVGGESTRPGAQKISAAEELRRILPTLKLIKKHTRVLISVDTYKSEVARRALDEGASLINDIMGVDPDRRLLKMIARYKAALVLMHIRGTPRSMQKRTRYRDLMGEIIQSLKNSTEICLESGIKSDKLIIDPGIGFGKTVAQNLEILDRLEELGALGYPILVGTSRKSFIGKILKNNVGERLTGSLSVMVASILKGAHIVRVHDVRAAAQAAQMTDAVLNYNRYDKE